MEISAFYNTAKNFADKIKNQKPEYVSDPDACLCLIIADTDEIFSGVTTIGVNDEGNVVTIPADTIAVMSLLANGKAKARQMINITFDDYGFFEPSQTSIDLLVKSGAENSSCQVVISPEESATAASMSNSTPDFISGFDDAVAPPLGAPADFSAGFDVDESNPFAAPGGDQPAAQNNQNGSSCMSQLLKLSSRVQADL